LTERADTSFGGETRHRLVEEFAVSFYNGTLKPNLAEKNTMDGREIEYLMDGPQFEKTKRSDVWSYSNAVGTGYQYKVVYKDKRYSDLDRLLEMYSGTVPTPEEDRPLVEEKLYQLILLLIREGRLPKTFKIQPLRSTEDERIASMLEEIGRSLDDLSKRVKKIEEQLDAQSTLKV
jgi:hypothetical protein